MLSPCRAYVSCLIGVGFFLGREQQETVIVSNKVWQTLM